jgi:hypothetical protein
VRRNLARTDKRYDPSANTHGAIPVRSLPHGFGLLLCNLNPGTPFRRLQIPAVIVDAIGVVLSLEEGDATTRFH